MTLHHLKKIIAENQILVVLFGLVAGLLFPETLRPLNHFSTQLLITVFFASSLRLSIPEIVNYAKDWRMLAIANAFMLIVLPFALYIPVAALAHAGWFSLNDSWAIALLILGAMPTGMTIALVADFFGGKTSLALVITATTSLLAPFTIPLVFKVAIGQNVPIPALHMFWSLFLTIVVPFAFAMLVKRGAPKFVARHDSAFRNLSVAAFGILIAGIVADTSGTTFLPLHLSDILTVTAVAIWLGLLTWVSYYLVRWRTPSERVTIALCMLYLNNTLALFIGDKFFHDLGVVPKQLLLLLVVNLLLPLLKWRAGRALHST